MAVKTISPSSWSGLAHGTTISTAGQLGIDGVAGTLTYKTWAGVGETCPRGGCLEYLGASRGFVEVGGASGTVRLMPTSGGTRPLINDGDVWAESMDLMFVAADETAIGAANASAMTDCQPNGNTCYWRHTLANESATNKQLVGVIGQARTNTAFGTAQHRGGINNAATDHPVMRFNAVHTWTRITKWSTDGYIAEMVDGEVVSLRYGDTTAAGGLSTNANNLGVTFYATTGVTMRILDRWIGSSGTGFINELARPYSPPYTEGGSNITRAFPACFRANPTVAADADFMPFKATVLAGAPTLTITTYGTGVRNDRSRYVVTGAANDSVKLVTAGYDGGQLGKLGTDRKGRSVIYAFEDYVPSGSKIVNVLAGASGSASLLAINMVSDGTNTVIREGATAGSGRMLASFPSATRFHWALCGEPKTGRVRFRWDDLTNSFASVNTVVGGATTLTWPSGNAFGVVEQTVTLAGASGPDLVAIAAGATVGYLAIDSYSADQTGGGISPALIVTGNNVGWHLSYGAESMLIPTGWRKGRPRSGSGVADVVYGVALGRSGATIENFRDQADELNGNAWCMDLGIACGVYNSLTGLTATNRDTYVSSIASAMGPVIASVVEDGTCTWLLPVMVRGQTNGNWSLASADYVVSRVPTAAYDAAAAVCGYPALAEGLVVVDLQAFDQQPFAGNTENAGTTGKIHIQLDTEGGKFTGNILGGPPWSKNRSAAARVQKGQAGWTLRPIEA